MLLGSIFALILLSIGFGGGYAFRASKSRIRRAAARKEWLRRRDQKRYDDGLAPKSSSIAFPISDEALETAAISDQLANLLRR